MNELNEEFLFIQKKFHYQIEAHSSDSENLKNGNILSLVKSEIDRISSPHRERIYQEFFGFGPLDALLKNPEITEIIVNGPQNIFFELKGQFLRHEDVFLSPSTYEQFIHRLCALVDKHFNLNDPSFDASWDQFRVHVIAPPLTKEHVCLTLRRHRETPWTLEDLKKNDWASIEQINFLKKMISEKNNFLIIGPTGCGKTSALNACLKKIGENERAVIIEDTDELALPNAISVKLKTRIDHNQQLKSIEQYDLLKQAMRMRPERLVLGEVRGIEAKDLLLSLSTGHKGSIGSLHANDVRQALIRLEMLVQLGAPQWSIEAIRTLIVLSIDYIVCLDINKGHRFLANIFRLVSVEKSAISIEPAL